MIYVLGSINKDMNFCLRRIPEAGETVMADGYYTSAGGKGANQAVAIAKLAGSAGRVAFIGCVGADESGRKLKKTLDDYGVDVSYIKTVKTDTGQAVIFQCNGDNRIVVNRGANAMLSVTDADTALKNATKEDTLLCQLEVPTDVVAHTLEFAKAKGMTTVLNPAPAIKLSARVYKNTDVIIPNETETKILTGILPSSTSSTEKAIKKLQSFGARYVIITQGGAGCTVSDGSGIIHLPALDVVPVDTTGAGDTFVGAFTLGYPKAGRLNFLEACQFATRAASITVTRRGAAESIPTLAEVSALYDNPIV